MYPRITACSSQSTMIDGWMDEWMDIEVLVLDAFATSDEMQVARDGINQALIVLRLP